MKSIAKFAAGAAVASALIKVLIRLQSRKKLKEDAAPTAMPTELVADSNSVGEGSGDDRVVLPDDGRIGQPTATRKSQI